MWKEAAMKDSATCILPWNIIGNTYFETNWSVFQLKHNNNNNNNNNNKIQLT
jgi:hypothetical protein